MEAVGANITLDINSVLVNDGELNALDFGTVRISADVSGNGSLEALNGTILVEGVTTSFAVATINEGALQVNAGAEVILSGKLFLTNGGTYSAVEQLAGTVDASLIAQSVEVTDGRMRMIETMEAGISGDFVISCSAASSPEDGGCDPPAYESSAASSVEVEVGGNFVLLGSPGVIHGSLIPMAVAGDFDNQSVGPLVFDWESRGIVMNGLAMQTFEVAGEERGSDPFGFDDNFAMGSVEVAAGASVTFVNNHVNTFGSGACDEALYVHELILREGSNVTVNNCRVYYDVLTNDGATLELSGCGQLVLLFCDDAAQCDDREICTSDTCDGGTCVHEGIVYGDVNGNGVVDLDDILCVIAGFGDPAACPTADIAGCAANGLIDLDDILAIIGAFGGADPCCSGG